MLEFFIVVTWHGSCLIGGLVGDDDVGEIRHGVQDAGEHTARRAPMSWEAMNGRRRRLDAGEGVAEGAGDVTRGWRSVDDVKQYARRCRRQPRTVPLCTSGTDDTEDHHQQADGGDGFAEQHTRAN